MRIDANTVSEYLKNLPEKRKGYFLELLETIRQNIPKGFEEQLSYGMIGFVVPHKKYPKGYHVNPERPLPFVNLAMQKNSISLYHMGIYARNDIQDWFINEYPNHAKYKLDMGKSCIRFKKPEDIPLELVQN